MEHELSPRRVTSPLLLLPSSLPTPRDCTLWKNKKEKNGGRAHVHNGCLSNRACFERNDGSSNHPSIHNPLICEILLFHCYALFVVCCLLSLSFLIHAHDPISKHFDWKLLKPPKSYGSVLAPQRSARTRPRRSARPGSRRWWQTCRPKPGTGSRKC